MKRCSPRRKVGVYLVVALSLSLGGALEVARGEDGIGAFLRSLFEGNREGEAQPDAREKAVMEDVPADFENQFTPHLKKLLNAELHFARKVCGLDAEQFASLEKSGRLTIAAIAKTYGKQQNQHESHQWPDAAEMLTKAFQKQLDALLPADVASRYREEVADRRRAKKESARDMMVMLIDRKLSLTPAQYEQVENTVDQNWDPTWSRNMQMYLYDDYAPMPGGDILKSVLTERQQQVWASRTNYGRISFGWEQDLGLVGPLGEVGELVVDAPAPEAGEQPSQANNEEQE
jgi:hypothetical protein